MPDEPSHDAADDQTPAPTDPDDPSSTAEPKPRFFAYGLIEDIDYDDLPPLVPKGEDRAKILAAVVEGWCTSLGKPDYIDAHLAAGGFMLDRVNLWDANTDEAIDLGDLLRAVEQRLRDEGAPDTFKQCPDVYILLSGCRVHVCNASGLNIRPRFVAIGVRFGHSARFLNATFGDSANFFRATFGDSASFFRATFGDSARFSNATFGDSASFGWATFGGSASFWNATFGDSANFEFATFGDSASFTAATFGEWAHFFSATFGDSASFRQGTFGKSASFSSATFKDSASFWQTTFGDFAHFEVAKFGNSARFWRATFGRSASFRVAKFGDYASFDFATFGHSAEFERTRVGPQATFDGTDFNWASLFDAELPEADLRTARRYILDATMVRGARFAALPRDPWSRLRRAYTGPRLIFNLLFLTLFFVPYAAKTAYWVGVNRTEQRVYETMTALGERTGELRDAHPEAAAALEQSVAAVHQKLPGPNNPNARRSRVGWLVIGADRQAWYYWVTAVLLIAYNVMRMLLTWVVAPMRDEEERSGHTPRYRLESWNDRFEEGFGYEAEPADTEEEADLDDAQEDPDRDDTDEEPERDEAEDEPDLDDAKDEEPDRDDTDEDQPGSPSRWERLKAWARRRWWYHVERHFEAYGWLTWPHRLTKGLFFLALVSFIYNALNWLMLEVYLPPVG